ncbi:hypothetical protein JHFBIEKO_4803 [Methylobacterium mesophilicum]|uniref:phage tail tape measure protein n=1 Tax=Methylobacterium mesophilicum TaxID=39956 RepID=UPI001EE18E32|nr:phage tail tape measure protein [Methylobacterium mesophilicum]GJE24331.1 hypothetical protein JHFBIEKO_4803 [Methylobacterium mesophilicum]
MADDQLKLNLDFDVKTTGTPELEGIEKTVGRLNAQLDALVAKSRAVASAMSSLGRGKGQSGPGASTDNRSLRDALGLEQGRLSVLKMQMRYRKQAETEATRAVERGRRAAERRFRDALSFTTAINRQRQAEERATQREIERTGRARIAEERRLDRDRSRSRRDASSHLSDAGRHGRDGYRALTRTPAVAAAAAGAGAAGLTRRAVRSEVDTDSAEIDARIYGALSKDAARALRDDWAAPLSEQLGVTTAKLLRSYTDALKLGIPKEGAAGFAELNTKISEAWSVPFETVTDTLGTINTLLTSKGEKFDIGRLKSVANTLQVLAAGQSTTPEKLISFLQRGAGAAQVLNMSQEAGLAFGSASTSLGNQAGQSGRLFDYMASRLIELPNLVRKKGDEGRNARSLISALGYGSAGDMERQRRADPDAFLPEFMSRFNKIRDPKKKEKATRFFAGREWMGGFGRMVQGADTYKEAVKLQKEAKSRDAIEEVWKLHLQKLKTVLGRIRSGALNILNEMGKVFAPILSDFSDYFLAWSRKLAGGGLKDRIKGLVDGFVEGLGFKDIPGMLNGMFGKPGEGSVGSVETFKAVARGFAEGIKQVFGAFRGLVGAFAGGDPETIGRWTGRIVALSVALTALSPVLAVLGGLVGILRAAAAIQGLAAVGTAAAAGVGGGAAAAAGGAAAMVWKTAGKMFGVGFLAEIAQYFNVLKPDANKGLLGNLLEELVPAPVRRWLDGEKKDGQPTTGWVDPPTKAKPAEQSAAEKVAAEQKRQTEILKEQLRLQQEALQLDKAKQLGDAAKKSAGGAITDSIHDSARSASSSVMSGTVGSNGGGPLGDTGMRRNGIIGGSGSETGTASSGQRVGGSRAWRNSNPGNLKDGPFARRMGATGRDAGGFAVFPNDATGRKAQESLLFNSDRYKNLSIRDAIARYAPGSDGNDPSSYAAQMARAAGVGVDTKLSDLTPDQRSKFLDAQRDKEGWRAGTVAGGQDGGSIAGTPGTTDGRSVPRMSGNLSMDGRTYQFGSGGHRGASSIPAGTYPLTPGTIGPWGRQHGALGINGNRIWDAQLGRFRDGIELHSASSAKMLSAGCLAINREQWGEFRSRALDFYRRNGNRAFLKVDSKGNASITAERPDDPVARVAAEDKKTKALAQDATKSKAPTIGDQSAGAGDSTPGKPGGLGQLDVTPTRPTSGGLGANVPIRQGAGASGGGGGGQGGGGHTVTVTNHINGAQDPKAVANEVQRHVQDAMNRRGHDFNPAWT